MVKKQASSSSSSQEIAIKLKSLIKEIPEDESADAARLDNLRRFFSGLVQQGDLVFSTESSKKDPSAQAQWNSWLQKQHKSTVQQLTRRIKRGKRTAVRTLWGLLAASPYVTPQGNLHVHAELLFQWLQALVTMPIDVTSDKSLRHLIEAEMSQRDIQYYAMRAITRWANETYEKSREHESKEETDVTLQDRAGRMMSLLIMIPFPKTQELLESSQNKYLFAPAAASKTRGTENRLGYEDQGESEESSDSEGSDNENSDDEESSDDDNNEQEKSNKQPSRKKRKIGRRSKGCFAYQDVQCHLGALSKAWIAMLRLPLSTSTLKKSLPFLSHHILPYVGHPLRFADLFMQAYGGASGSDDATLAHANNVIPLLALDGLFYLMTQHRLEYPQFYAQLYALLKPKLFYVKYRTRFFALLHKCLLRNEMLPAHIVAAFLKRLLQCALTAPPSGALFVLALSSNLLRQHEECAALIHRAELANDEFDPETDDPVMCKALQSSLWEVAALEKHYHPAVSTLAKSIGREDPKSPMLQLDDMAQHTYDSLIEQERKRNPGGKKRKHTYYDKDAKPTTPVTFVPPAGLFSSSDVFAGILKTSSTD